MIQRIQTVWLLLAAAVAFLMTRVALFAATLAGAPDKEYRTSENLLLFAITAIAGLLALAAVFLFKNRRLQSRLSFFGLLCSIVLIGLELWQYEQFRTANLNMTASYAWGSLLPIAIMIFFFMAIRGIRKDEKLIKSLNRFR